MTKQLLILTILLASFWCEAQDLKELDRLQCRGKVPADFSQLFSEKYGSELESKVLQGSNESRRNQMEFAALTHYTIDNLLNSGKVLYGDPISVYCNQVLDVLLKDQPDLRQKLRLYLVKSNDVNAYSTHQGIIMVTVGLVARLENEAQLAFVLAHEVTHFVEKHNLESFSYNKQLFTSDMRSRKLTIDDKLLRSAKHSKKSEFEADQDGWTLYTKAGYDPQQILKSFDILLRSYLPHEIDSVQFETLEDEHFKIRPKAKSFKYTEIEPEENVNDSFSSHPNVYKRKKLVLDRIKKEAPKGKDLEKVKNADFANIQKLAYKESIHIMFTDSKYIEALMYLDKWKSKYPKDKVFYRHARAMAFYGIQTQANEKGFSYLRDNLDLEGPQVSYYHLFKNLKLAEINVLALREISKIASEDSSVIIQKFLDGSIGQIASRTYFKTIFFSKVPSDSTKLARADRKCYNCYSAFRAEQFAGLLKQISNRKNGINTDDEDDDYEDENEEDDQDAQTKKSVGYAPLSVKAGNDKTRMIMLTPRYFGMDMRRSIQKRFLKSESKQKKLEADMVDIAAKFDIQAEILDAKFDGSVSTKRINEYNMLVDWLKQNVGRSEYPMPGLNYLQLEALRNQYNADYMAISLYWNLVEPKKFRPLLGVASAALIYTFPIYLYWQVTPYSAMGYTFVTIDLRSGDIVYADVKEFNIKYRNYVAKSHFYNSLNQIK